MPESGLQRLWRRLAHPIDPIAAADVLVGLRPGNARQLLAVAVAASDEAEALLDGVPSLLRSLSVSTTSRPIRCDGEIRGPVLWSETMAARSASPGAGGVFICASPTKAYDTDENRVLVAALHRIVRAARMADSAVVGAHRPSEHDLRRSRINGERAHRALEHRSLQAVSRVPVSGRMALKARTGTKAAVFRTAVDFLQRASTHVEPDDLDPYVDARTKTEHVLAADVADVLEARQQLPERLRIVDGLLVGGPFAYGHPGRDDADDRAGVSIDGRPITSLRQL